MRSVNNETRATMTKRRNFVNYATMTLSNGTVLNLTPADFRISGNTFTDDLVDGESFQVGTTIGKTATILLDNTDERFSQYDFYMAYFYLDVHLPDAYTSGTSTVDAVFRIGKFTVVEPATTGTVITITAVDEMYKFDKPFDNCNLNFSTSPTLYTILVKCCTDCGVAVGFTGFDNQNLTVSKKPEGITYRQVVSYICQIAGANAKISGTGALILTWYDMSSLDIEGLDGGTFSYPGTTSYLDGDVADGGSFNPWNTGYEFNGGSFTDNLGFHQLMWLKDANISTDDIQITGVKVTFEDTVRLSGTDAYAIEVNENPFTEGRESTIASYLYNKLKVLRFRPFSCSHVQDPTIEAGDCALLWDAKGNGYKTIITNVSFSVNNFMTISCNAQAPAKQGSTYVNAAAQAVVQARRNTEQQIDEYSQVVSHFNELANNSLGYYKTTQTESGATVTYIHDQPQLSSSTIIWKITSTGIFISEDGGQSYTAGFDASTATMLVNLVYAVGIKCDWIHTGTLTLGGYNNTNGWLRILAQDGLTQIGKWSKDGIEINSGSITIKRNVSGQMVTYFSVTSNGSMTARAGYIGNGSSGWTIGDTSIHNGCNGIDDASHTGTYVGTNGIRNQGSNGKKVRITGGGIEANSGNIGGFNITDNSLGNVIGSDNAVGMISSEQLYAWASGKACRIKFGLIQIYTGSQSNTGLRVYNSSPSVDGDYIHYGHSDVYRTSDSKSVEWSSSDRRLKEDIEDLDLDEAKDLINSVRPRKFRFKKDEYNRGIRYGFIAQELKEILPEDSGIEYVNDHDFHNIYYSDFISPLCMMVKDLQAQIDELKAEIVELKNK